MNKAGGIIAIIAGIFGIFAAGFTLLFGGLASAFNAHGSGTVVALGWGGVGFSFLTIVFGALALSGIRWAGIGIIICAIAGAILGGTLVAVFMVLSLIGGILVLIDSKSRKSQNLNTATPQVGELKTSEMQVNTSMVGYENKPKNKGLLVGGITLLVISLIGCIAYIVNTKSKSNQTDISTQPSPNPEKPTANSSSPTKNEPTVIENAIPEKSVGAGSDAVISEILSAKPEITNHRTIVDCLLSLTNPGMASLSDRENCERILTKEPVADLTVGVDSINHKEGKYIVNARGHLGARLYAFAYPRTDAEKATLENLRMGDAIHLKGKLVLDKNLKAYIISPAYLLPLEIQSNKKIDDTKTTSNSEVTPPTTAINQNIAVKVATYQICNLNDDGEKFLALKEGANASSARITKMPEGSTVTLIEKNGEWFQVKLANGSIGWANSKWLCETSGTAAQNNKQLSTSTPLPSKSPSFNCQNATTRVEKLICSNEELSDLDVQLSLIYKKALSVDSEKALLKKYQDNWRKNIRDACTQEACVKLAYKSRIAELK